MYNLRQNDDKNYSEQRKVRMPRLPAVTSRSGSIYYRVTESMVTWDTYCTISKTDATMELKHGTCITNQHEKCINQQHETHITASMWSTDLQVEWEHAFLSIIKNYYHELPREHISLGIMQHVQLTYREARTLANQLSAGMADQVTMRPVYGRSGQSRSMARGQLRSGVKQALTVLPANYLAINGCREEEWVVEQKRDRME